jgi:hypothetical protein
VTTGTRLRLLVLLCMSVLLTSAYGCGGKSKGTDAGTDADTDASSLCGDGICSEDEDHISCPADCEPPAECGNGIVEAGEDCDHGGDVQGCVDCRFECYENSDCDDGNPCTDFADCRAHDDVRYCDDYFRPLANGTSCGENMECAAGQCVQYCETSADCENTFCGGEGTCDDDGICRQESPEEDGTVCDLEDESEGICLASVCVESTCGDDYVDEAAGEECEPPGEGACDENCQIAGECREDEDCEDDDNVCTGIQVCNEYACEASGVPEDGTPCGDGLRCFGGECMVADCETDAECGGDICGGFGTCNQTTFECEAGIPADNGTECGEGLVCFDGACRDGCTSNAQCEDDNTCNGYETCNLTTFTCTPGTNEPTGVDCDGGVCRDGECVSEYCTLNSHCNDGNPCNGTETCDLATVSCQSGEGLADGTTCGGELEVCVSEECQTVACTNDTHCDDDNACNGSGSCDTSSFTCQTGAGLPDGTQCGGELDICVNEVCESVACLNDGHCDDDNPCTVGESCDTSSFSCQAGTNAPNGTSCGTDMACSNGTCVPSDCSSDVDCDDGNACNGVETCNLGTFQCESGTAPGNGTQCGATELDVCVGTTCQNVDCVNDTYCDDDNICTGTATCNLGTFQCESGTGPGDGTQCGATETDVCVGTTCQNVECVDNSYCPNDGDPCNGEESCNLGTFQCQSTGALGEGEQCGGDPLWICKSSECTQVECVSGGDCNDGNACNGTETCDFATNMCQDGTAPAPGTSCGGGNLCNAYEQCVTPTCTTDAFCNDGNICNGTETCDLSIYECQDGTPPGEGTQCGGETDICLGGVCESVECTLDSHCVDGNICNGTETCSGSYECQAGTQAPDGESCGGGNICEAGECVPGPEAVCGNGVLEGDEQCDDGNVDNNDGCSANCNIETAFRVTQIQVVDPHFFIIEELDISFGGGTGTPKGCQDFTNNDVTIKTNHWTNPADIQVPSVNGMLNESLVPDAEGNISLSLIFVTDPLVQTGTGHAGRVVTADCAAVDGGCTDPVEQGATTYGNGTCIAPIPNTMNPTWAADLNTPTANCFLSQPTAVTLDFSGILLPLYDAVLGGEWNANPATGVNEGVIRGFVARSDADNINILAALNFDGVSGEIWLSTLLPGGRNGRLTQPTSVDPFPACRAANEGAPNYERDTHGVHGQGWWFYINYDAVKLNDWYEAP